MHLIISEPKLKDFCVENVEKKNKKNKSKKEKKKITFTSDVWYHVNNPRW